MDGRTTRQSDRQTDRQTNRPTDEQMNEKIEGPMFMTSLRLVLQWSNIFWEQWFISETIQREQCRSMRYTSPMEDISPFDLETLRKSSLL